MTANERWLAARRLEAWRTGIELRERLLAAYMHAEGLRERPLIKDVLDDLVEGVQKARLLDGVLLLDTFAQSERVRGRIVVTVNSRIADMPGVKDAAGVRTVAVAHEAMHVDRDFAPANANLPVQLVLPEVAVSDTPVIICRSAGGAGRAGQPAQEFMAENGALAMVIALPDLKQCAAFVEFRRLASYGGELGGTGWRLLYDIAEFLGVNISALVTYFKHRNLCYVVPDGRKQRLMAAPRLFDVDDSLEPVTWTSNSIAS